MYGISSVSPRLAVYQNNLDTDVGIDDITNSSLSIPLKCFLGTTLGAEALINFS